MAGGSAGSGSLIATADLDSSTTWGCASSVARLCNSSSSLRKGSSMETSLSPRRRAAYRRKAYRFVAAWCLQANLDRRVTAAFCAAARAVSEIHSPQGGIEAAS